MKAQKSSIEHRIQSNGALKSSLNGSSLSLADAIELGFIDYKFTDVEMNLPIVRAETYGKLEVRTTFDFYNNIYLAFNADNFYKMNLFADKLYMENGMFRLESIGCNSVASNEIPIYVFLFNYRLSNYFIQQCSDVQNLNLIVAKLINDMCKVCINSTLEGGYSDE